MGSGGPGRTTTASDVQHAAFALIDETSTLRSRRQVAEALFDHVQRLIGFDMGTVQRLKGPASPYNRGKSDAQVACWGERCSGYLQTMTALTSAARTQGHVILDHDTLCARDRDRAPAYAEYFRPYGLRSNLALFVCDGESYSDLFAIARAGRRNTRFSDAELGILRLLYPAIAISLRAFPVAPGQRADGATDGARALAALTPRERQLARLVARGLRNAEIAHVCGTSPNTVRNQLVTLFRKLDVTTRAELAAQVAAQVATGTNVPL